jgi:SOS-response transcriptional repressor LexA
VSVQAVELPLLGRVAAGSPIQAIQASETIFVPEDMVGHGEMVIALLARVKPTFVDQDDLRVQGVVIGVLRRY